MSPLGFPRHCRFDIKPWLDCIDKLSQRAMKLGTFGQVCLCLLAVLVYEHTAKLNGYQRLSPLIESAANSARDLFIYLGTQLALFSSWILYLHLGDLLATVWDLLDPLFRLAFSFVAFLDGYSRESLKLASPLAILVGTLVTVAALNWIWMRTTGKPSVFNIAAAYAVKLWFLLRQVVLGKPSDRQLRTYVLSGNPEEKSSSSSEFDGELESSSEEEEDDGVEEDRVGPSVSVSDALDDILLAHQGRAAPLYTKSVNGVAMPRARRRQARSLSVSVVDMVPD